MKKAIYAVLFVVLAGLATVGPVGRPATLAQNTIPGTTHYMPFLSDRSGFTGQSTIPGRLFYLPLLSDLASTD